MPVLAEFRALSAFAVQDRLERSGANQVGGDQADHLGVVLPAELLHLRAMLECDLGFRAIFPGSPQSLPRRSPSTKARAKGAGHPSCLRRR